MESLQEELEAKNAELESLRKTYEEYMESSLALEQELEDSLKAADDNCAAMTKKKQIAEEKLSLMQDKYTQVSKEINTIQADLTKARDQIAALDAVKRTLESSNDGLLDRVRVLEATEEDLRHKLANAEEELVMLKCEMDEMQAEHKERESQLKSELTELQAELAQLAMEPEVNDEGIDIQSATPDDSNNDTEELISSPNNAVDMNDIGIDIGISSPQDAPLSPSANPSSVENVQEELIQELELEVEALTSKLVSVEAQNEQLNEELSKMSDELIEIHENHAAELQAIKDAVKQELAAKQAELEAAQSKETSASAENELQDGKTTSSTQGDIIASPCSLDEFEAMRVRCNEAQSTVEALRKELYVVSDELAQARDTLADNETRNNARSDVLHLLEADVAKLTDQLQRKTNELETVLAVAAEVKASHDAAMLELNNEIQQLTIKVDQLSSEKYDLMQSLEDKVRLAESLSVQVSARNGWEAERSEMQLTIEMWKKRAAAITSPNSINRSKSPTRSITPSRRISFRPTAASACDDIIGDQISKVMTPAAKEMLGLMGSNESRSLLGTISPNERPTSPILTPSEVFASASKKVKRRLLGAGDPVVIDSSSSLSISAANAVASGDIELMKAEILSQSKLLESLRLSNARMLQKFQAARGNILVGCRTRPPSAAELRQGHGNKICIDVIDDNELACFDKKSDVWRPFLFDRVWSMNATQADVFADVEPLVMSVVDGYNCCLFAYGQTGSGKTFTMNGYGDQYGVSYRTLHRMFELLMLKEMQAMNEANIIRCRATAMMDEAGFGTGPLGGSQENALDSEVAAASEHGDHRASGTNDGLTDENDDPKEIPFKYEVFVSIMEIYNDQVMDLLVPPGTGRPLDIRQAADGSISVPDLTQVAVRSFEDVMTVFAQGSACRATASTNMNEHSSRSHLLLQVDVTTIVNGGTPVKAKLFLVDLAGSERLSKSGAVGTAMKEAQYINKSLSALGDVMEALDQKSKHIPYRNSKLTYLLQDCLGGNSRTMMVITLCPTESTSDETLFTLQFATRVRNITLGAARKNVNAKNLEDALKSLKVMLRESKRKRSQLEETVTDLKKEVKKTSEKMSTQMDSKLRMVEDFKRDAAAQLATISKHNTELESRVHEEREAKNHLQQEVDSLQKTLKKVNDQLKEMQREREAVLLTARQRDREIAYLKLKSGAPINSRGPSEMLAGSSNLASAGEVRNILSPKTLPTSTSPIHQLPSTSASSLLKTPTPATLLTSPGSGDRKRESGFGLDNSNLVSSTNRSAVVVTSDGDELPLGDIHSDKVSRMLPPSALPMPVRNTAASKTKPTASAEKGSSRIPQSAERMLTSTPVASSSSKSGDLSTGKTSSLMRGTSSSQGKSASGATKSTSSGVQGSSRITKPTSLSSQLAAEAKAANSSSSGGALPGKPTGGSTISSSRQSIAQRSKEALLKHQERMRAKALADTEGQKS